MRNRSKSLWKNKSKCYSHKRPVSKVSWDESLPRQPSDVGLLREPPCPGCPPELWGFPGHFQCRERFCHLRNPWNRKMINQQENKKPGEEVSFSWCNLHRAGIMGNGAEKAWSERFILEWIKAADFGQSWICQGCDRVGAGALGCCKERSELHEVRGTPLLLQHAQGMLLWDSSLGSRPNGAVEEQSYRFSLLFSKHNIVFQK